MKYLTSCIWMGLIKFLNSFLCVVPKVGGWLPFWFGVSDPFNEELKLPAVNASITYFF